MMSEHTIFIYTIFTNYYFEATKQELDDSRRALEDLKAKATALEQETADLKANGLTPMSTRACEDKLKRSEKYQESDALLVEFFTITEGRDISGLVSLPNTDHVP